MGSWLIAHGPGVTSTRPALAKGHQEGQLTDTHNSTVTSCAKPETAPRPQLVILDGEAWDRTDLRSAARRNADEGEGTWPKRSVQIGSERP